MTSIILDSETGKLQLSQLIQQLGTGGVEVRDSHGKIIAMILAPTDKEALTYAEAMVDLAQNRDQMRAALGRRDGVTTSELLAKAAAAQQ
jgi:hypothetical protein